MAYKIAVFSEAYSDNLGDAFIWMALEKTLSLSGVSAIPIDLSGRYSFSKAYGGAERIKDNKIIQLMRIVVRKHRIVRRILSAVKWYSYMTKEIRNIWSSNIKGCDAVIIGGGQLITDLDFGFPPKFDHVVRLANKHNKPLAIFGCGCGSTLGVIAGKIYKKAIQYSSFVSVRDSNSKAILSSLAGGAKAIYVNPDIAFAIKRACSPINVTQEDNLLALNVMAADHIRHIVPELSSLTNDKSALFYSRIVEGAISSGWKVELLTNGDQRDFLEASRVSEIVKSRGLEVRLLPRPTRPESLLLDISRASAMISTRMHAGVAAYGLGKAVVPLSWDKKVRGVWSEVRCGSMVQDKLIFFENDPWGIIEPVLSSSAPENIEGLIERIDAAANTCLDALRL